MDAAPRLSGPLRLVVSLGWLLGLLLTPASVLADHCGADATVTPASGPPGTRFVFETNLGEPSDLHLYRDGGLMRSVPLDDDDLVTYAIRTRAGDAGTWRARAEVRGQSECAAEATFTVVGTPDTSTVSESSRLRVPWGLVLVAGAVAGAVAFRRLPLSRRS